MEFHTNKHRTFPITCGLGGPLKQPSTAQKSTVECASLSHPESRTVAARVAVAEM